VSASAQNGMSILAVVIGKIHGLNSVKSALKLMIPLLLT